MNQPKSKFWEKKEKKEPEVRVNQFHKYWWSIAIFSVWLWRQTLCRLRFHAWTAWTEPEQIAFTEKWGGTSYGRYQVRGCHCCRIFTNKRFRWKDSP